VLKSLNLFLHALVDKKLMPTAIKVALVVGTILFAINHGSAVAQGKMTRDRALSALLTYFVPYTVNIHGQFISRQRRS
jgi:hypothetical protein